MKKIFFLLIIMLLFSTPKAYTKDEGIWDGSDKYKEGWSEWSYIDSNPNESVRKKIYLGAINWSGEFNNRNIYNNPVYLVGPNGGTVSSANRRAWTYGTEYWEGSRVCGDQVRSDQNYPWSDSDICSKEGSEYGTCSKDGGYNPTHNGFCTKNKDDVCWLGNNKPCLDPFTKKPDPEYTHSCRAKICRLWVGTSIQKCNYNNITYNYSACPNEEHFLVQTTSQFADIKNKSNWKTSLDLAGGWGKEAYIYSYPLDFNVIYDGNGSEGTCTFKRDKDGIVYEKGNPVCENGTTQVKGTMPNQKISFSNGGYLEKTKYYKTGYDFGGWYVEGSDKVFKEGEKVTAQDLAVRPGGTVTLKAKWIKHNYKIEYLKKCGEFNKDGYFETYQYGENKKLPIIKENSCGNEGNTSFIGWYETLTGKGDYLNRRDYITPELHEDITFYAKQRQKRYYDYSNNGQWVIE